MGSMLTGPSSSARSSVLGLPPHWEMRKRSPTLFHLLCSTYEVEIFGPEALDFQHLNWPVFYTHEV
jgi:hypothetical protein